MQVMPKIKKNKLQDIFNILRKKCAIFKLSFLIFRNVGGAITNFRKTYPGPTVFLCIILNSYSSLHRQKIMK